MNAYADAGGNFIDTADVYSGWVPGGSVGRSEEIIGRWLKKRGNRHEYVIATKGHGRMWNGPNGEGVLSFKHIRPYFPPSPPGLMSVQELSLHDALPKTKTVRKPSLSALWCEKTVSDLMTLSPGSTELGQAQEIILK